MFLALAHDLPPVPRHTRQKQREHNPRGKTPARAEGVDWRLWASLAFAATLPELITSEFNQKLSIAV